MNEGDDETIHAIATANRLLAADMFDTLTPEQWRTPSLCEGWTIREIAAHFLSPLETKFSVPRLLFNVIRYRGSLDRMVDDHTRKLSARPVEQIVSSLREHASVRLDPPVVGALGPMTDTCIHLRDAARPLGLEVNPPPESWRPALEFMVSRPATRGFVPKGRVDGLRLVVTDQDWTSGDGAELRGSSEAVTLAVAGRAVALDELDGPGVDVLRTRLKS